MFLQEVKEDNLKGKEVKKLPANLNNYFQGDLVLYTMKGTCTNIGMITSHIGIEICPSTEIRK